MRVNCGKYAIMNKNFPVMFDDGKGNLMDYIEDAYFYFSKDIAENQLSTFDNPDGFQVVKVNVTYEF